MIYRIQWQDRTGKWWNAIGSKYFTQDQALIDLAWLKVECPTLFRLSPHRIWYEFGPGEQDGFAVDLTRG